MDKDKINAEHIERATNSPPLDEKNHTSTTTRDPNLNLASVTAARPPKPWSKQMLKLYGILLVLYLCATMQGYDGSLMGSINALNEYQDYFKGQHNTGLVFSIYQIGQICASAFLWISDTWGRRFSVAAGLSIVILGTIVQGTAHTMNQFIAGRFLLAFGSGVPAMTAPLFVVELAHPNYRGTLTGLYNTLWYMGSIIATFTVYGTSINMPGSNLTFLLPIWLQLLCPAISLVLMYLLVPESPRWLIANGKFEQAKDFIIKYHGENDPSHPLVELELAEIEEAIRNDNGSDKRPWDYRGLYKTPSARYRSLMVIFMAWFGQFSGNNIATYYLPKMTEIAGVKSTNMQLLLTAIYSVISWISAMAGARCHDILGRRPMLMISTFSMTVCFAIIAATTAIFERTASPTSSIASIVFIYLFGVVFAFGFTPMQVTYPAECLTSEMRAKGMSLNLLVLGTAGFVNNYAAPVAMANLTWKFYIFFMCWDAFEGFAVWMWFVETKGRTMEELEEVFSAPNPKKASLVKPGSTRHGGVEMI
ncbi:hypothetical protein YB2330_006365 [Saitoella coloradoensis]